MRYDKYMLGRVYVSHMCMYYYNKLYNNMCVLACSMIILCVIVLIIITILINKML